MRHKNQPWKARRRGSYRRVWGRRGFPRTKKMAGKYKLLNIYPKKGESRYSCVLRDYKPCIKVDTSNCMGCPVLCRRRRKHPTRKCETCEFKFMCWTGEFDTHD